MTLSPDSKTPSCPNEGEITASVAHLARPLILIALVANGLINPCHAAVTDCLGENSDGTAVGMAVCTSPVPTPLDSTAAADGWVYTLDDRSHLLNLGAWCEAFGGTIFLQLR